MNTNRKAKRLDMPRMHLLVALLLAVAANIFAQSNQVVDRLLDEKPAAFGDAAYVILSAVGFVTENATGDEATAAVAERKLLKETPSASSPVTLGQACFLIMETQGIKGGLLYSLFPGPRYAARELAAKGFLKENTHPNRVINGEEVMWILGAVLNSKEKM